MITQGEAEELSICTSNDQCFAGDVNLVCRLVKHNSRTTELLIKLDKCEMPAAFVINVKDLT